MSSEWDEVTFDKAPFEIIDGDRGANYPKQHDFSAIGHCLFLNAGNVTRDGFSFSECSFITVEKDEKLRKGKLKKNDLVLTTRGTIGNVGYFGDSIGFKHIRINSGMVILRPNAEQLLPYYLYLFLRSQVFRSQMSSLMSGSAQPQLPIRDLNRVELPIPPVREQHRICQTLGVLDNRITLLRETNKTLESIAQAIFKSWFVDFDPVRAKMEGRQPEGMDEETAALFPDSFEELEQGLVPTGWSMSSFGQCLDHTIGGDWGTEEATDINNIRVAIIRGTDIPDLQAHNTSRVPIRFTSAKKLKSRQLQSGDIVIEVSGGSKDQPTGRSLLITDEILEKFDCPVEPASFCRLFRPKNKYISHILNQKMQYLYTEGKTWEYQNQSTGIANFQTSFFLENEQVVVPTDGIYKCFLGLVAPLVSKSNSLLITSLVELRDTLLPRLISGQLRLPEAQEQVEDALS